MKKFPAIALVLLIFPVFLQGQSIKSAQKEMERFDFSKAIEILKEAVIKPETRNEAIPLLAECYRQQREFFESKVWYAQAVSLPEAKPETFYDYALALKATGNYPLAKEMFQKYNQMAPGDKRVNNLLAGCDSALMVWKEKDPTFETRDIKEINTAQSDFGAATYDGKLIFASDYIKKTGSENTYGWTGRGYLDIYSAEPVNANDFFGEFKAPQSFDKNINQMYHDGPATFSPDGNQIYFTRVYNDEAKREGKYRTNRLKIFYAEKKNGAWADVKPFSLNNSDYSVGHPAFSPDGKTLYFVSDMPGGIGGTDIWKSEKQGNKWGAPVNLGAIINTAENEMFPYVAPNGTLYFSSGGHPGYGGMDIFRSSFQNNTWSVPVNLFEPFNSSYDDFAFAFAPDGKHGFISSNRPGGVGNDDIYAFGQLPPKVIPVTLPSYITGVVKDRKTLQPLAGATVFVVNPETNRVKILKTDAQGIYKMEVSKLANYQLKAMAVNYLADCLPFALTAVEPGKTYDAPRDMLLDKLELRRTFRIDNIYYDFDKSFIRADAKPPLDNLIRIMKENPIKVELSSHTDCRGTFDYNDKLSQRRADAAVEYLIQNGIAADRLIAQGYGEHQLTNRCADGVECSAAEHQANRRTEFKIIGETEIKTVSDAFDPNRFKEGSEVDIFSMPAGFFTQCHDESIKVSDNGENVPTSVTSAGKEPIAIGYYVIAGSFPSQELANKAMDKFTAAGYSQATVLPAKNGYYRIALQKFNNMEQAKSFLTKVKAKYEDAWIYID